MDNRLPSVDSVDGLQTLSIAILISTSTIVSRSTQSPGVPASCGVAVLEGAEVLVQRCHRLERDPGRQGGGSGGEDLLHRLDVLVAVDVQLPLVRYRGQAA